MTIARKGLLGELSGKLGSVVIFERNGSIIIRTNPIQKPHRLSPQVIACRERFAQVQKIIKAIKPFIDLGYRDSAGDNRIPYRVALSANLYASRNANDANDLMWLQPSTGYRAGTQDLNLQVSDMQALITWGEPIPYAPSSSADLAIILAINTHTLITNPLSLSVRRKDKQAIINLPGNTAEDEFRVFIFFYDEEGGLREKNLNNVSKAQIVNF